ncbi:hypothetical protein F4809DRAFT_271031 [Biscogniauxia mediterranea]|nr:hypothetical protein F4809DRAFT_271031 [Biscogniauxia mediterranea]
MKTLLVLLVVILTTPKHVVEWDGDNVITRYLLIWGVLRTPSFWGPVKTPWSFLFLSLNRPGGLPSLPMLEVIIYVALHSVILAPFRTSSKQNKRTEKKRKKETSTWEEPLLNKELRLSGLETSRISEHFPGSTLYLCPELHVPSVCIPSPLIKAMTEDPRRRAWGNATSPHAGTAELWCLFI